MFPRIVVAALVALPALVSVSDYMCTFERTFLLNLFRRLLPEALAVPAVNATSVNFTAVSPRRHWRALHSQWSC